VAIDNPSAPTGVRKPPTLYDVAALAGVSHQTVSRLVKGHTNIRPEIRERVEAAISALNYKPNLVARSLATAKSHRIGALFFDRLDEVGPTRSVQAASDRAREAGYLLDIVGLDPRAISEIDKALELVSQGDVAGIMVFAPTDAVLTAVLKARFSVPVYIESDTVRPIDKKRPTANALGTRMATEHLADLGHRRFVHIAGPLDWFAARARRDSYDQVIAMRNLESIGVYEGDWSPQSGYEAALRIPHDAGVTAIVTGNDQMALGVLMALRERGLSVPEDISVVGFDDIPESRFFHPPLTTVRIDFDRQGAFAMERLLEMIDPEINVRPTDPLVAELVLRGSSAAAPIG
jgi:LacI family transcriptional regulator